MGRVENLSEEINKNKKKISNPELRERKKRKDSGEKTTKQKKDGSENAPARTKGGGHPSWPGVNSNKTNTRRSFVREGERFGREARHDDKVKGGTRQTGNRTSGQTFIPTEHANEGGRGRGRLIKLTALGDLSKVRSTSPDDYLALLTNKQPRGKRVESNNQNGRGGKGGTGED